MIIKKKTNSRGLILITAVLLIWGCAPDGREGTQDSIPDTAALELVSWEIFRGDSGLSGVSKTRLPDNLGRLWSFDTEAEVISSPVLGLGNAFVGSTNGKVFAIGLSDGKKGGSSTP